MLKTTFATLLLLGLVKVNGQDYQYADEAPAAYPEDTKTDYTTPDNTYQEVTVTKDKTIEYDSSYHFEKITNKTYDEIQGYWTNRTGGEYCITLFKQIKQTYEETVVEHTKLEKVVTEFEEKCSKDLCLPGYVHCEGDYSGNCVLPCDCCQQHDKVCCDSHNHPYDAYAHDYAVGYYADYEEVLYCYDWCCEDDEYYCQGKCIPDGVEKNYCHATPAYGDYKPYPKTCCCEEECCEGYESWVQHLYTCCVLDTVIHEKSNDYDKDLCCCEYENQLCCPDLKHPCQPADNYLCCDEDEIICNGQCWPKDKPCCTYPETNCALRDDKCMTCCCEYGYTCCEYEVGCIPEDAPCCEYKCNGKCIGKDDHCCPYGTEWCEYSKKCQEHCCDEYNGYKWCEHTYKCETCCCEDGYDCCEYENNKCVEVGKCCPYGTSYCEYTKQCEEHCCEYNKYKHDVYCPITYQCEDECDCCAEGTKACKCTSGKYGTDTKCYDIHGEECCEDFWCVVDGYGKCVKDHDACCELGGIPYYTWVVDAYGHGHCCADNHYNHEVNAYSLDDGTGYEVGCCWTSDDGYDNTCCKASTDYEKCHWDTYTKKCVCIPVPECPCEGCCDFNCCDELDFFMHKAFYENYKDQGYDTFLDFYESWYEEFYAWWHGPAEGYDKHYNDYEKAY